MFWLLRIFLRQSRVTSVFVATVAKQKQQVRINHKVFGAQCAEKSNQSSLKNILKTDKCVCNIFIVNCVMT